MTQNSTVTWMRQDASWSPASGVEVRTTDSSVPDVPYVQGAGSLPSLTYTSSNPSIASIRSFVGILTFTGQAGSTVITANLPANGNGGAASSASYTLTVYDPAAQIKLTTTPLSVKVGMSLTLAASMMLNNVDTGFPRSAQNAANNYFSYAVGKAGDTGSASIDSRSGRLTGLTAGSVTVKVTLNSTRQYAAMSAEFVVTVEKGNSVFSWVSVPATSIKMGETPAALLASHSGSTTVVAYSSSAPGVATIDPAGVITLVGPGSTTISAVLLGDSNYNAAPTLSYTLTVEKGVSVLNWAGTPVTSIRMDETPSPVAVSRSGSTAAVVYRSSAPAVATIDATSGVITLVNPGTTTITATLAEDSNYNAAPTLTYTLVVAKGVRALNWVGTPVASIKMGETLANPVASHSGSPAAVVYSSSASNVAVIDAATGVITLVGAGTTTISAVLLEDAGYQAVTITYTLTVAKGDSTLSWVSTSAASIKMGGTPSIPQVSHSGSTTAVVYSSSDANVARIDAATGIITLVGIGSVTISATLPEDANYQAPAPVSYTFTVERGESALSWSHPLAASVSMGDVLPAFAVSRSGSAAAIAYSSDAPGVATIDASGIVTLCGLGRVTITAVLAADNNYYAAPAAVTHTMVVSRGDVAISLLYRPFSVYVNEKLTLVPVAKRVDTGTVVVDDLTYRYAVGKVGDTGTATIDAASGVLTGLSSGSVTVTVTCTSNLYQVTGTECTVTVLATSCVVSLPATTKTIKLGGGNDPSYQIIPTTKLNGVVIRDGAPYENTAYDFSYSYTLSNVSPLGSVTVSQDGLITGTHFGTATVTITVNFTTPSLSSVSTTLLVTVIEGNPDNPKPISGSADATYPAYTGNEPPQLAAVQALLDDLMPVAQGQSHDDPNSTAAQLFGLDLSYFENIKPDGKKIVFPISENNNIYQINCTAISHLRLKATKELVLGDSLSFTFTRGNTFNFNVNLNNKDDRAGQDANNDGVDDSVRTGHGVVNTSIVGVAAELQMKAFSTHEDDLYPYQKNVGMADTSINSVYLPKFSKLRLDYGRVNSSRRDRVVKMEFIGPGKANKNSASVKNDHDKNNGNLNTLEPIKRHPDRLVPEECAYAEFTQITRDGFKPYKGRSKGIGGGGRGNPSILPDETHLGLLGDYFHDDADGAKAMAGYDTIDLPDYVLNDELFDTTQADGGVNFLQFRKGKGRLRHEYMDNTIKMLQKAKAIFNVNIAGGIRDFFVAGAVSELDFTATMICHSWISPVGLNTTLFIVSTNLTFFTIRSNGSYSMVDCEDHMIAYLSSEWYFGIRINEGLTRAEEAAASQKATALLNENHLASITAKAIHYDNTEIQHLVSMVNADRGGILIKKILVGHVESAAVTMLGAA